MSEPAIEGSAPAHAGEVCRSLVDSVIAHERRLRLITIGLLALAVLIAGILGGGLLGPRSPHLAQFALAIAVITAFGLAVFAAAQRRRTPEAAVRLIGAKEPRLVHEIRSAVELSRALPRESFSPTLARAFLHDVDNRVERLRAESLVDRSPPLRAALALCVLLLLCAIFASRIGPGLRGALTTSTKEALTRTPLTGDFELSFTYPPHTGLEPRTVSASTGDVTAPTGTVVALVARADRSVSKALLVFDDGRHLPLTVDGRTLSGQFTVTKSGRYHISFLGIWDRLIAEGPDMSIQAQADTPPQVRLISPMGEIELKPTTREVLVKYEADDDYGLSALELSYEVDGQKAERISLGSDTTRSRRGEYLWDLTPLKLEPGQTVRARIIATDNDAISGPKPGTSSAFTLKLYSAEEHVRAALARGAALWEKLVELLADRLESNDRDPGATVAAVGAGVAIDTRAAALAEDFAQVVPLLRADRGASPVLATALRNFSQKLKSDTARLIAQRRAAVGLANPGGFFAPLIAGDIERRENDVLYLESLLHRQRLDALTSMGKELRSQRQELQQLLEKFAKAKDPALQQAALEQIAKLESRLGMLRRGLAELSQGMRDGFINPEALQELMSEKNIGSALQAMRDLIKDGKTPEAMKELQALGMQLESLLDGIRQEGKSAGQMLDPALAREFQSIRQSLDNLVEQESALAEQTRGISDRAKAAERRALAEKGPAMFRDAKKTLNELSELWDRATSASPHVEATKREALRALDNTQQAIDGNDFGMAREASERLAEAARGFADAAEMHERPRQLNSPARSQAAELRSGAERALDLAMRMHELIPPPNKHLTPEARNTLRQLAQKQQALAQDAQKLMGKFSAFEEKAPIFGDENRDQVRNAAEKLDRAAEELEQGDAPQGFGQQQSALKLLRGLQRSVAKSATGSGGVPMPLADQRNGFGHERVEIPDEGTNRAPKELRQEMLELMKQGAPESYREQNKRYYEELVR